MISKARIKEMGPVGLWVLYALHKGLLAETTITRDVRGKPLAINFRYFYLGVPNLVGVCDERCRMVLDAANFKKQEWYGELEERHPEEELQGPAFSPLSSSLAVNKLRKEAAVVFKVMRTPDFSSKKPKLGKSSGKPKLKARRGKPKLGPASQLKLPFKPKLTSMTKPFKLKRKSPTIDALDRPDAGRTLLYNKAEDKYLETADPDKAERLSIEEGYIEVTGEARHEKAYQRRKERKPLFKLKGRP